MEILSIILGILGLVATLVGTYFTYISFINPIQRFKKYLKHPADWEEFEGIENLLSIYRHKKYPNFRIIIDWDKKIVENFQEDWIKDYPDMIHNSSHYVQLEANSMLLDKELFVSLDGGRIFVPAPQINILKNGEREFYYDNNQIQLANIIGDYYIESNIYEFAKNQKKPIKIIEGK